MPWTRRQFVASVGALVARETVTAQRDDGSGTPRVTALDTFAIAPTGDGPRLVGELLIQPAPGAPVEIGEVRLTRAGSGAVVRRLTGADLQTRLGEVRTGAALATASIPANAAAVVFLWEAIDAGEVIAGVEVDVVTTEMATVRRRSTLGVPVTAAASAAVRLGRPLAGGDPWVALYDPAMPRGHRRASFEIDGRLVVPARFAIDFVRLDNDGSPGPADDFGRWSGFGHDVLAVAGGTVAAARDAFLDVLTRTRPATWTDDDVAGNYVILEVAPRTFACYEHLQRGSVRVKAGDMVQAGDVIARLGRSGVNSSGPHLHFHVADAASPLAAQGRPYTLSPFQVVGRYPDVASALAGRPWPAPSAGASPTDSGWLPAANSVVRFGPGG